VSVDQAYDDADRDRRDADPGVCGDVLWCGLPAGHDAGDEPLGGHAITADGVYDLPAAVYHSDPVLGGSLTASGVRKIRPPGCPQAYQWWRENSEPPTPATDAGTLAHAVLLDTFDDTVAVVETNNGAWNTDKIRAKLADARAAGKVPVKPEALPIVMDMVDALQAHPSAWPLLSVGDTEMTIVWTDPDTGVRCRALLDILPAAVGGIIQLADYKTARKVDQDAIERAIDEYGYHIQMAFRRRGLRALGLADEVECFDICQQTERPHLVNVVELDEPSLRVGDFEVREALKTYAECARTGVWPGPGGGPAGTDPVLAGLPYWTLRRYEGLI
jgi:hypothetical protein